MIFCRPTASSSMVHCRALVLPVAKASSSSPQAHSPCPAAGAAVQQPGCLVAHPLLQDQQPATCLQTRTTRQCHSQQKSIDAHIRRQQVTDGVVHISLLNAAGCFLSESTHWVASQWLAANERAVLEESLLSWTRSCGSCKRPGVLTDVPSVLLAPHIRPQSSDVKQMAQLLPGLARDALQQKACPY